MKFILNAIESADESCHASPPGPSALQPEKKSKAAKAAFIAHIKMFTLEWIRNSARATITRL